jgi:hypothetical protein
MVRASATIDVAWPRVELVPLVMLITRPNPPNTGSRHRLLLDRVGAKGQASLDRLQLHRQTRRPTDDSPHPGYAFFLFESTQYRESLGISCHRGTLRP